jgi:hypothetical protein
MGDGSFLCIKLYHSGLSVIFQVHSPTLRSLLLFDIFETNQWLMTAYGVTFKNMFWRVFPKRRAQ